MYTVDGKIIFCTCAHKHNDMTSGKDCLISKQLCGTCITGCMRNTEGYTNNNADLSFTLFVILFMVYSVEKLQGG